MTYQPTLESLRRHPLPEWYDNAKLGIFIHWGLYSVPGWAPLTGELSEVIAKEGSTYWFANNPYAEWYLNSINVEGSPSQQYHAATYGESFSYDGFVPLFNEDAAKMDPDAWADLFAGARARYVVLTTKHHDGFTLWPSHHANPHKPGYQTERDLVGEVAQAVRARGMKMGLYYSGGLDYTFNDTVIRNMASFILAVPQSAEYTEYANDQLRELIARYQPSVLWGDIAYPASADLKELFAYYYNTVPDGVINDRFTQFRLPDNVSEEDLRKILDGVTEMLASGDAPAGIHYDFRTPEYASYSEIVERKWESTRGLGYSFGYNRQERPENLISADELVRSFVDIVSKNGNLLINVGPMADGTIPVMQQERLLGLGEWLTVNGEAIFDTRPWVEAEGDTSDGKAVRFTQKSDALYAILLDTPQGKQVSIESLVAAQGARVHLLGHDAALNWAQDGDNLTITLPERLPHSPALAMRIVPQPRWVSTR